MFRDKLSVPSSEGFFLFLNLQDGTDSLSRIVGKTFRDNLSVPRNVGKKLPMFRDNLSVPSSEVFFDSWTFRMGPIGCLETSVRNHRCSQRNKPQERSSQLLHDGSLKSRILRVVSESWTVRDVEGVSRGLVWGNVLVLEINKTSVKFSLCSGRDMNLVPPEYDAVPLWLIIGFTLSSVTSLSSVFHSSPLV